MVNLERVAFKPLFGGIVDERLRFNATYSGGMELPLITDSVDRMRNLRTLELTRIGSIDGMKDSAHQHAIHCLFRKKEVCAH